MSVCGRACLDGSACQHPVPKPGVACAQHRQELVRSLLQRNYTEELADRLDTLRGIIEMAADGDTVFDERVIKQAESMGMAGAQYDEPEPVRRHVTKIVQPPDGVIINTDRRRLAVAGELLLGTMEHAKEDLYAVEMRQMLARGDRLVTSPDLEMSDLPLVTHPVTPIQVVPVMPGSWYFSAVGTTTEEDEGVMQELRAAVDLTVASTWLEFHDGMISGAGLEWERLGDPCELDHAITAGFMADPPATRAHLVGSAGGDTERALWGHVSGGFHNMQKASVFTGKASGQVQCVVLRRHR